MRTREGLGLMIRRIAGIDGHGIWNGYRWGTSLPDLQRLNVIYGPNGSGKSTLARALDATRSIEEGYKGLSVEFEDGHGRRTTSYKDDPIFDRLYVFGEEFVQRSHRFHEGDPSLDAVLTLGERAADAEDKIAELQTELATKREEAEKANTAAENAEKAANKAYDRVADAVVGDLSKTGLKQYASRGTYSKKAVKARYSGSRSKWKKLSDEDLAAKKAFVLSGNRDALTDVIVSVDGGDELRDQAQELLGTTPLTIVLDTLQSHPHASNWVQQGKALHEEAEECIFCGRDLPENRLRDIERHFSTEVGDLQGKLDGLLGTLANLVQRADDALKALPARGLLFDDLHDRYDTATEAWRADMRTLKKALGELSARVEAKRADVLNSVDSVVEEIPWVDGQAVYELLGEHNDRVNQHAQLVDEAATAIEQHHLLAEAKEVDNQVRLQAEEVDRAQKARARAQEITQEIAKLEQVDGDPTPSAKVLTREIARLLGRNELTFEAKDGKYVVTRDGQPATNLSLGERNAIALVHFFEVVACHDESKGPALVVIDDPVSSLDSNVYMGISTYIWTAAMKDKIAQLILLTHNYELFRQWDIQFDGLPQPRKQPEPYPNSLYEIKSRHEIGKDKTPRRCAVLHKWPESGIVRKKVRSSYHHAFIAVAEAKEKLEAADTMEHRLDAQLLFPNVIRRLLESFLAFKRPELVGNFTHSMRKAGELLDESNYPGDSHALRQQLTRYTHAYSHSDTPDTSATVNPDEILSSIVALFVFMHQLDPEHFDGLCEVVGKNPIKLLREIK